MLLLQFDFKKLKSALQLQLWNTAVGLKKTNCTNTKITSDGLKDIY